ncbi:MAG: Unsaturated rhamnogalacturonyl hydrolase YteR [Pseudomonadota bacterium]|jgi:rhamnogalacturonyl hydrolase YesR
MRKSGALLIHLPLLLFMANPGAHAQTIGMSAGRMPIEALSVPAQQAEAPDVVVIGGLTANAASSNEVRAAYEAYANSPDNFLDVTFIPLANPGAETLAFPPPEPAYSGNWTAWSLWQWFAAHAPDAVLIVGDDNGLGAALSAGIAGLGNIPVTAYAYDRPLLDIISGPRKIATSPAHAALIARSKRSAADMAQGLAGVYGQELGALTYIPGMALIGRLRLGQIAEVESIVAPQLDAIEALVIDNSLQIAGHLLFAELAERTNNPRYLALARRAADLGFAADGRPLDAMPFHGDYSDAFFMATPLLAKVGKLTGDTRYFDLALNHVNFLHDLLLREDGLYNHWPRAEAAWGRGNAFVALGLALALSDIPDTHPAQARLLELFRAHLQTLLRYQDTDGMWRNIIDVPGSYPELSATAMIATAIQRGVDRGWLDAFFQNSADSAWKGVVARSDETYGFRDVCESTPGQESFELYLNRRALGGRDDRAGGMTLMLATERMD